MIYYQEPFSEEELEAHRNHWIAVGLSTEPVDRLATEQGLAQAYETAGLKAPSKIIYCDSPHQGLLKAEKLINQAGSPVVRQVWRQVSNQVSNQAANQITDQITTEVYNQVEEHVWEHVWDRTWSAVGELVMYQIEDLLGEQNGLYIEDLFYYAQHEADSLSRLMVYRDIPEIARLAGLVQIAENAGWCLLFENLAIVTARPSRLVWRKAQCIHIEYPDGWSVSKLSPLERLADVC